MSNPNDEANLEIPATRLLVIYIQQQLLLSLGWSFSYACIINCVPSWSIKTSSIFSHLLSHPWSLSLCFLIRRKCFLVQNLKHFACAMLTVSVSFWFCLFTLILTIPYRTLTGPLSNNNFILIQLRRMKCVNFVCLFVLVVPLRIQGEITEGKSCRVFPKPFLLIFCHGAVPTQSAEYDKTRIWKCVWVPQGKGL